MRELVIRFERGGGQLTVEWGCHRWGLSGGAGETAGLRLTVEFCSFGSVWR